MRRLKKASFENYSSVYPSKVVWQLWPADAEFVAYDIEAILIFNQPGAAADKVIGVPLYVGFSTTAMAKEWVETEGINVFPFWITHDTLFVFDDDGVVVEEILLSLPSDDDFKAGDVEISPTVRSSSWFAVSAPLPHGIRFKRRPPTMDSFAAFCFPVSPYNDLNRNSFSQRLSIQIDKMVLFVARWLYLL